MYQSNKSEKEGEFGTASLFVKLFLHKKAFHAVKNYLFEVIKRTIINISECLTVKFIYSEKATKFCEISTNYLTGST